MALYITLLRFSLFGKLEKYLEVILNSFRKKEAGIPKFKADFTVYNNKNMLFRIC